MRKGTKKIRQVNIRGEMYFVYDLDRDESGKIRRVYGRTLEETEEKIRVLKEESEKKFAKMIPNNSQLKDYVKFFFKKSVGAIDAVTIKDSITLFEQMVFGTEIDTDMTAVTQQDMENFYLKLKEKYPAANVLKVDGLLRKIFTLANESGVQTFDYSNIPVPEEEKSEMFHDVPVEYMLSQEEMDRLKDYLVHDRGRRKRSERVYQLMLFLIDTGITVFNAAKLLNRDFSIENRTVKTAEVPIPLSEECMLWLEKITAKKVIELIKQMETAENEGRDVTGIPCYTCPVQLSDKTVEQAMEELAANPELLESFVKNYMEKYPEEYFFINKTGGQYTTFPHVHRALQKVVEKAGMAKGITLGSIHKSFIALEMENGKSPELIKERYGYYSKTDVTNIKAEYDAKRFLQS